MGATPAINGLRVELSNGRRIVVEDGFDALHLKRLVAALEDRLRLDRITRYGKRSETPSDLRPRLLD